MKLQPGGCEIRVSASKSPLHVLILDDWNNCLIDEVGPAHDVLRQSDRVIGLEQGETVAGAHFVPSAEALLPLPQCFGSSNAL